MSSSDEELFIQAADLVGSPDSQIFFDAFDPELDKRFNISDKYSPGDLTQIQSDNTPDDNDNNGNIGDNTSDNTSGNTSDNMCTIKKTDTHDHDISDGDTESHKTDIDIVDADCLTSIPVQVKLSDNASSISNCQEEISSHNDDHVKSGQSINRSAGENERNNLEDRNINISECNTVLTDTSVVCNPEPVSGIQPEKETVLPKTTETPKQCDNFPRECTETIVDQKPFSGLTGTPNLEAEVCVDSDGEDAHSEVSTINGCDHYAIKTDGSNVSLLEELANADLLDETKNSNKENLYVQTAPTVLDTNDHGFQNPDQAELNGNNLAAYIPEAPSSPSSTAIPNLQSTLDDNTSMAKSQIDIERSMSQGFEYNRTGDPATESSDIAVPTCDDDDAKSTTYGDSFDCSYEHYDFPSDFGNAPDFVEDTGAPSVQPHRRMDSEVAETYSQASMKGAPKPGNYTEETVAENEPIVDLKSLHNSDIDAKPCQNSDVFVEIVSERGKTEQDSYGALQPGVNQESYSSSHQSSTTSYEVDDAAMQKSLQNDQTIYKPNVLHTSYDTPYTTDQLKDAPKLYTEKYEYVSGESREFSQSQHLSGESKEFSQSQHLSGESKEFSQSQHVHKRPINKSHQSIGSVSDSADETTPLLQGNHQHIKVYHRRWWILLLFCLCSFMQGIGWGMWGPITQSMKAAFQWTDSSIALTGLIGNVGYVVSAVPVSYMLDKTGMRVSMIFSILTIGIGFAIRCISAEPTFFLWSAVVGQGLIGVGAVMPFSAVSHISSLWFPQTQRTTATSVATVFGYFGVASGFIVSPGLVPDPVFNRSNTSHDTTETIRTVFSTDKITENCTNIAEIKDAVMRMQYYETGACGIILLLFLIYFPAKPPTPPSLSAHLERLQFVEGIKSLLRNKQFLFVLIAYSVGTGVYGVFGIILDIVLNPLGVSQNTAGWMGFWATVGGMLAAIIVSAISDVFTRRLKQFILLMLVLTFGILVWFCLMVTKLIPHDEESLYFTVVAPGAFIFATSPLFYEYGCEASYPTGEGITTLALTACNNIIGIIFLLIFMIPNLGLDWMNWFLLASVGLSIVILVPIGVRYRRTNIDLEITVEPPDSLTSSGTIQA